MTLELQGLRYDVGGKSIVHGTDLAIPTGAVTGILGPNGAGKSTLLHLIAGTLRPGGGSVQLEGQNLLALGRRARARRVALVEQDASTDLSLTVRDIALLGRMPYRTMLAGDSAEDLRLTSASLEAVGMTGFADRLFDTLSGGEQQRVQLARALVQEPALLLLDEPTNHLDIHAQLSVLSLIRGLAKQGVTPIAALHDLNLAAEFCDHLIVLAGGHVVSAGTPAQVLTPNTIRTVYAVNADVLRHPVSQRPVVTYSGTVD